MTIAHFVLSILNLAIYLLNDSSKMFAGTEIFGEDVSDLVFARNKMNLNVTTSNFFTDKIKIDFDMFNMSMLNKIDCYVCNE